MKKINKLVIILILSFLIGGLAKAQILNDSGFMKSAADDTAKAANFGNLDIGTIIALVIKAVLGFLGIIFIILMIVSGFRWMTASGNPEQVTKATDTIRTAIIGLIIVLSAYAITYFVMTYLPFGGGGGLSNTNAV